MDLLDRSRSVVVVIDIQGKLVDAVHRRDLLLAATGRLLRLAELFAVPVLLSEQYPEGLGPTHPDIAAAFDVLTVPKARVAKTSFGCCGDAGFMAELASLRPRGGAPRQVVVAGIEAHVCVLQTVLALLQHGDQVHLCWDCVTGRGEEYRRHALDRMAAAGAVLTNHESVGFEWCRDKNDPGFKALNRLLKGGQPA